MIQILLGYAVVLMCSAPIWYYFGKREAIFRHKLTQQYKKHRVLLDFLGTLDPKAELVEYSQKLLEFSYNNKQYPLGQPECVGNVGPSNIESYIQIGDKKVYFRETVSNAIKATKD